ncbi:MAG: endolytic transglycosylase MltG [Bacteroidales bacterium]
MVRRKISRKTPGYLRISKWIILGAIVIALFFAVRLYRIIFLPGAEIPEGESVVLYIPEGMDYSWLEEKLIAEDIISDPQAFKWLAKKKNFHNHINAGRYRISAGMSNNELINMIRAGRQEPFMFMFNNLRTLNELAGIAGKEFEADSSEFSEYFNDPATAEKIGFTSETLPAMFIPNSYEFYWTTDPTEFVDRMKREYIAFWSDGKEKAAEKAGLDRVEVSILASIVEEESLHEDENPRIAGVFINRLQQGIPLQSDPTLIFARQDYTVRRVLNHDKKIDSPYNTYLNRGLPPGPICIPSIAAIEGVLNYEEHNYLFFSAKPDFSGYHNFARTLSQHNKNARLYQQALNRRKIYR